MISHADYEITPLEAEEQPGAQPMPEASVPAPLPEPRAAVALTDLVQQTNELCQWILKQLSASNKIAAGPALPERDATNSIGQKEEPLLPQQSPPGAEEIRVRLPEPSTRIPVPVPAPVPSPSNPAAEPSMPPSIEDQNEMEEAPTSEVLADQPARGRKQIPPSQDALEEADENDFRPESSTRARDFNNRFDSVRSRVGNETQHDDELEELLEQAITLLESVSQHPALRDYSANKRKLEEIEQRLGYGSYPQ